MTHQELIDSAASYALDALDGDERAKFEAHLAACRECQSEVAAFREVAGVLAHAAPTDVSPPSALRERILRDARQVRPITVASRANGSRSPTPRGRGSVAPWIVAVASLAAAAVFAFVSLGERNEAARLRGELAEARASLARGDSALAAFLGPEVHVVSLSASPTQKPGLRVFWNHTGNAFIVTALGLPPAPAGKTYQLWAIRKGKPPMSMGTFDPDPSGRTTKMLAVTQEINDGGFIDDCALTVEPVGGSGQPTEAPRLIGSWRHVD